MKMNRVHCLGLSVLSATLLVGSGIGSASAESACKGLEQGVCEGKADCTWVGGYVRKDGVNVAAYCKSRGKSSGASAQDKKVASGEKKSGSKE
jgi:hypothetical protein